MKIAEALVMRLLRKLERLAERVTGTERAVRMVEDGAVKLIRSAVQDANREAVNRIDYVRDELIRRIEALERKA